MTIQDRISEVEQKFNTKQEERNSYLKLADECTIEMNRLQGAFSALSDLQGIDEVTTKAEAAKDAN